MLLTTFYTWFPSFIGVFIATSGEICWHTKGEGSETIAADASKPMEPCRSQYGATVPGGKYFDTFEDNDFMWTVNK
jgi:hypothetical protein